MKFNYGAVVAMTLILLVRSSLVASQESQMQPQLVSGLNGTGCAWNSTKIGGSMARVNNCNNTNEVKFSNFTFSLPNNSVILGIEITVNATIISEACEMLQIATPTTKSQQLTFCNTSLYSRYFGGFNETWNMTNLHYDAINSPVFGFEYWISSNKSHNTSVDAVSLIVYYNVTTPPSSTTESSSGGSNSGSAPSLASGSGSSTESSDTGSSSLPSSTSESSSDGTTNPGTSSSTGQTNAIQSSSGLMVSSTLLIIILASILGGLLLILIIVIIIFAVYRSKRRSMGALHEPMFEDHPSKDIIIEMKPPPVPPLVLADLVVPIHSFQERIQKLSQPLPTPHSHLTGFHQEFLYIESVTDVTDKSKFLAALLPGNSSRNRYQNILAQDVSRVKLLGQESETESDYINANYISGQIPGTEKAYIATQGPVMEHADTFWRMVWQENCSIVLMLTRIVEGNKIKCDVYWAEEEQPVSTDSFEIILLSSHQKDEGLTVRDLKITEKKSGESKRVKQFQYTVWPDHGVPASSAVFLELSHMADQANTSHGPLIVHCSAGVGRTGTFCAIHATLQKLDADLKADAHADPTVNMVDFVIKMRSQRANMIQTPEQYQFCYQAINDGAKELFAKYGSDPMRGTSGDGSKDQDSSSTSSSSSSDDDSK